MDSRGGREAALRSKGMVLVMDEDLSRNLETSLHSL